MYMTSKSNNLHKWQAGQKLLSEGNILSESLSISCPSKVYKNVFAWKMTTDKAKLVEHFLTILWMMKYWNALYCSTSHIPFTVRISPWTTCSVDFGSRVSEDAVPFYARNSAGWVYFFSVLFPFSFSIALVNTFYKLKYCLKLKSSTKNHHIVQIYRTSVIEGIFIQLLTGSIYTFGIFKHKVSRWSVT